MPKLSNAQHQSDWRSRNIVKARIQAKQYSKKYILKLKSSFTDEEREAWKRKEAQRQRNYRARRKLRLAQETTPVLEPKTDVVRKRKAKSYAIQQISDENLVIASSYSINRPDPQFVAVKSEKIDELNVVVESSLCRCCFNALKFSEIQYPLDEQLMSMFRDLTQLTLQPCPQASNICESCYNQLQSFIQFKASIIAKQGQFEESMRNSGDSTEIFEMQFETLLNNEMKEREIVKQEKCFEDNQPFVASEGENSMYEYKQKSAEDDKPSVQLQAKKSYKKKKLLYPECPQCLKKVYNLDRHLLSTHPIKCKKCRFKCINEKKLKRHMNLNHKPPESSCDHCDYSTYFKTSLEYHMKLHRNERLECHLCEFKAISRNHLIQHSDSKHPGEKRPPAATCYKCGKHFGTRKYLETHMKIHDERNRISCSQCKLIFYTKDALKVHWRNQHEGRNYTCEICGRASGSIILLKRHMETHKTRDLACDCCPKKFNSKIKLRNHVEIVHLNIRKHVCETCGKGYTHSIDLYVHKLQHRGIKFHCYVPGCTSAVTRRDVLLFHMRNSHNLSPAEQEEYKNKLDDYWDAIKPKK